MADEEAAAAAPANADSEYCDCPECSSQFLDKAFLKLERSSLRHSEFAIPDDVARSTARKLADKAQEDWQYIRDQLALHGDAIKTKWMKMDQKQQAQTLQGVQPDIYPQCMMVQAVFYNQEKLRNSVKEFSGASSPSHGKMMSLVDEPYRNGFLVPYFNLESLLQDPLRLLGLLHHRSAHALEEWVATDSEGIKPAFDFGWLFPKYNDNSVILHGPRYGELMPYYKQDAHYQTTIGYPRAALILEAQHVLYGFLRKVVDTLAFGSTAQGRAKLDALLLRETSKTTSESWSQSASAPFSAPRQFNPAESLKRAEAQLADATDHLAFLQTDPVYFLHYIDGYRRGSMFGGLSDAEQLKFLVSDLTVIDADFVRRLWVLVHKLKAVVRLQEYYKDHISIGTALPEDLDRAMSELEYVCATYFDYERKELGAILSHVPVPVHHPTAGGRSNVAARQDAKSRVGPLHFPLRMLTQTCESETPIQTPSELLGLIDDCLCFYGKTEERAPLDPRLYNRLTRICCYYDLLSALRLHRPRPRIFTEEDLLNCQTNDVLAALGVSIECQNRSINLTDQYKALGGIWNEKWPKGQRNQAWLEQATRIRDGMAALWKSARECRQTDLIAKSLDESCLTHDLRIISADLSEDYLAEIAAEKLKVEQTMARRKAKKEAAKRPADPVQTVWGEDNPGKKFEIPIGRTKPKTRPNDQAPDAPEEVAILEQDDADEPAKPRIAVTAESLKLFAKMFPVYTDDISNRCVKWQQLVAAMADAGFAASHSGGSAVHFTSTNASISGSIVFHKPHPDAIVDPIMLQAMGKRMKKWFGWSQETFVDRKKERH